MRNESGKSIVILIILTILVMIGVAITINYAKEMVAETKIQDLRTNMLLMQAKVKKGLEEVCFQTVNLDESKEDDMKKINEIKQEYLEGIKLSEAPVEVQEAVKNVSNVEINDNCYYLDETTLTEIGIKNIDSNDFGYFIVIYDFEKAGIEVINTKGYDGNYTLTQIVKAIETKQEVTQEGVE